MRDAQESEGGSRICYSHYVGEWMEMSKIESILLSMLHVNRTIWHGMEWIGLNWMGVSCDGSIYSLDECAIFSISGFFGNRRPMLWHVFD